MDEVREMKAITAARSSHALVEPQTYRRRTRRSHCIVAGAQPNRPNVGVAVL